MLDRWAALMTEADKEVVARARYGHRMGMGSRPAVLVIDVQNCTVGPPKGSTVDYPLACPGAIDALPRIRAMLDVARDAGCPVIYTRWELRRDGSDIGVFGRKRELLQTEGFALEGSEGAEIVDEVAPHPEDLVLVKKKWSAFFGTPLASLLIDRGVDSVIVVGGSTSNCVRAAVIDAAQLSFRVAIVEDCVFDRISISHDVALFEMDAKYGDVVTSDEVISHLQALAPTKSAGFAPAGSSR